MDRLPPPPCPPTPTHGTLRPPTPAHTVSSTQPQPQAPNTPVSQFAQLQQQPHATCSTVAQAAATPGVNAAQSTPTKPRSHTWPWFLKFLRVCAALLASGSIILFIYYQLRADQRDGRNFDYTVRSYNLSAWTAHKDYCDFQLSHDNNSNADTCLVGPPPVGLLKIKRWVQGKTAVWNDTMRTHVFQYGLLAAGLVATLSLFASFVLHQRFRQSGRLAVRPERLTNNKEKRTEALPLAHELKYDDLDSLIPTEASGSDLVGTILGRFVTATFHDPNRAYLPENAIKELIVQGAIEQELAKIGRYPNEQTIRWDRERRSQLATWIRNKAPKVFAIAIQCDFEPYFLLLAMVVFQRYGFTDEKLPMVDRPPCSLRFPPRIWNQLKIVNFQENQWKCLAPVFIQQKYNYDLKAQCIFPFVSDGAVPKDGAFSSVYRVTIHKDHHEYPEIQQVALKELKVPQGGEQAAGTDRAWNFEATALEAIRKLDHAHIVKCIAAIRRGHSRYFMFPWADGDSLRDFWTDTPREAPNACIVENTIVQLRGIVDALDRLHNFDGGRPKNESGVNGLAIKLNDSGVVESHLSGGSDAGSENGLDSEVDEYKNAENAESIRHGDLKPENILRFLGKGSKSGLGTLKIADMGLAKRHVVATQERGKATSTRYGTRRYEAPETVTGENARSRLYDIWSMGCITFEFIIWILYGNDELNNFYKQIEGNAQQICQYYEVLDASEPESARVHPVVLKWMEHIQNKDPECSAGRGSAIKDLLKIVREMLLVVNLPPNRKSGTLRGRPLLPPALGQSVTHYRATAAQFRDALDDILRKRDTRGYMFTGKDRINVRTPTFTAPMLSPNSANLPLSNLQPSGPLKSGVLGRPIGADYTLPPLKDWEFQIDNNFADKVVETVGVQGFIPQTRLTHKVCALCSTRDFLEGGFSIEEQVSALEDRAPNCDLCRMLYEIHNQAEDPKGNRAIFQRDQSSIIMTGDSYPVLSLIRSPNTDLPCPLQVGFPELPQAGSEAFFNIIKLWLDDCDINHRGCHGLPQNLPTRLLDVGTISTPTLRLVETKRERMSSEQYIALSHPWGDTTRYPPFCTLPENLDNHLRAIAESDLPATFDDAVRCTRKIGIRYLWVDSLCIIQGESGDFNKESKNMEAYFSGAYCVLAANRASNQRDGFLGPRPEREYLTIQRGDEKPFYVCKTIDNFSKDVIEGSLNKRGWVLQERALARRTIYFTDNQTYFECGQGVRCETLTRLHNNMADFLGDPNFPNKAMRANRARKIAYFQGLYKQYSRLEFTHYSDRPFAIAGLEKRLQSAFTTRGAFGIFDDGDKEDGGLFHRSLLWQRGEEEGDLRNMAPIEFPLARKVKVPSWSWMAYRGGIDYIDPPFDQADWERTEIVPPWTRGGNKLPMADTSPQDDEIAIIARVRDFKVAGRLPEEVKITYDAERTSASDGQIFQCVIVAKMKGGSSNLLRRYYVLLVTAVQGTTGRGEKKYRRVGAGFMLGKYISLEGDGIAARIV